MPLRSARDRRGPGPAQAVHETGTLSCSSFRGPPRRSWSRSRCNVPVEDRLERHATAPLPGGAARAVPLPRRARRWSGPHDARGSPPASSRERNLPGEGLVGRCLRRSTPARRGSPGPVRPRGLRTLRAAGGAGLGPEASRAAGPPKLPACGADPGRVRERGRAGQRPSYDVHASCTRQPRPSNGVPTSPGEHGRRAAGQDR